MQPNGEKERESLTQAEAYELVGAWGLGSSSDSKISIDQIAAALRSNPTEIRDALDAMRVKKERERLRELRRVPRWAYAILASVPFVWGAIGLFFVKQHAVAVALENASKGPSIARSSDSPLLGLAKLDTSSELPFLNGSASSDSFLPEITLSAASGLKDLGVHLSDLTTLKTDLVKLKSHTTTRRHHVGLIVPSATAQPAPAEAPQATDASFAFDASQLAKVPDNLFSMTISGDPSTFESQEKAHFPASFHQVFGKSGSHYSFSSSSNRHGEARGYGRGLGVATISIDGSGLESLSKNDQRKLMRKFAEIARDRRALVSKQFAIKAGAGTGSTIYLNGKPLPSDTKWTTDPESMADSTAP